MNKEKSIASIIRKATNKAELLMKDMSSRKLDSISYCTQLNEILKDLDQANKYMKGVNNE